MLPLDLFTPDIRTELNAHWLRLHLNSVGAMENGTNLLLNNNKSHTVTTPQTVTLLKLSLLGHHTCCIHHPRYELRWPIMLGCYWLDAAENKRPLTKWSSVVCQNSRSTSPTTSDKVKQIIERTLVWVSIHLKCLLLLGLQWVLHATAI